GPRHRGADLYGELLRREREVVDPHLNFFGRGLAGKPGRRERGDQDGGAEDTPARYCCSYAHDALALALERGVDNGEMLLTALERDGRDAEHRAQLVVRHFHRARRR